MTPWRLGHRTVLLLLLLAEKHPVYEVLECSLTPSCSSPRLGLGPVHSSCHPLRLSTPLELNCYIAAFALHGECRASHSDRLQPRKFIVRRDMRENSCR